MKVLLLLLCVYTANGRQFEFINNLPYEIWVGSQGNYGYAPLNNGGWKLAPGQRMSLYPANNWQGRFWGRTGCVNNYCQTGDCGKGLQCAGNGGAPPATVAEILLAKDGKDYYDISLVDGYNVGISIEPSGGKPDGSQYSCKRTSCINPSILSDCRGDLQKKNTAGKVVACNSMCSRYNEPRYCCIPPYKRPNCKPETWSYNSAQFFKNKCRDAYSYADDDQKSTYTCNAPKYIITFG